MTDAETAVRKDRAALRRVVDLALRGIRAKSRPTARPQGEARWVMSSDGVIGAPTHGEPHPSEP